MKTKWLVVSLALATMLLQTAAFARQANKELSSISNRERTMEPSGAADIGRDTEELFGGLLKPFEWMWSWGKEEAEK